MAFLLILATPPIGAITFPCKNPEKFQKVEDALKVTERSNLDTVTYLIEFPPELHGRKFSYADLIVGTPEISFVRVSLHPDWSVVRTDKGWMYEQVDSTNSGMPMSVLAYYGDYNCRTLATIVVRK